MSKIWRALASVMVVSLMLAVTMVPLADAPLVNGSADADAPGPDDGYRNLSNEVPNLRDNGDGTFTFNFPYLEKTFGIKAKDIAYGDPSHNTIDIRPMELHYYDGADANLMYKPTEGSGSSVGEYEITNGTVMSKGIARGVEFGMLLKDNSDGHEDLVNYGININNVFFIQMAGAEGKITFDSSESEYMTYVVNNYSCLSPMQSMNILPYTVGNFTEDDSEEIALFMGDCIYLCDYIDGSIVHYDSLYLEKNTSSTVDPYGHAPMLNPVSMTAADTDGDGIDEILVSVEYSETHESPSACCMGSHMTVLSLMDPNPTSGEDPVKTSRVYMDHINSTIGITEHLDSVMTSVCLDDIDFDGDFEIVIGGYMWDNGNHEFDITLNKDYYTGELYLGLLNPGDIKDGVNVSPRNLVVPMDDDGTASNGIDPENKYDDRDEFDHYPKDTSIFTEDGSENDFGYCRSNNWVNWTIPLTVLDMRGNGFTNVVYFDYSLFNVYPDKFVYLDSVEPPYVQDNNNCCLISLDAAYVHPRADDSCLGYQDLFRFMALDTKGNGDVLWHSDLHYMVDETVYRQEFANYVYYGWEEPSSDAPMSCLVDWDASDTIRAKYLGSVSTITDPVVLAAVSAIPYDEDLAYLLLHGNNDVGSTSFTMYSGTDTATESTMSTSFEMGGSLETFFMETSVSGGWFGEIGKSHTQSFELDTTFETSTDSVVLQITPYYSYTYAAFMGNNGNPTMDLQTITEFDKPVCIILDKVEYEKFITEYNYLMNKYAEKTQEVGRLTDPNYTVTFNKLPIIHPFDDHVEGDVSTYNSTPKETLTDPQSFVYFGKNDAGSVSESIMLSQSTSDTSTGGGMMNAELSSGCVAFINVGMGFESSSSTTTTDNSGVGFSAELNDGLESSYYDPYNPDEAHEVLTQYAVKGDLWATKLNDEDMSYIYVGYTVSSCNTGAKIGNLEPDISNQNIPGDKNDPLNPAYGRTYMEITIPGEYRNDQEAMYYSLEINFQEIWYDVGSTEWNIDGNSFKLGLNEVVFDSDGKVVMEEVTKIEDGKEVTREVPKVRSTGDTVGEEVLYHPDIVFVPQQKNERSIWVEVSNLEHISNLYGQYSFEFRLVGFSYEDVREPVTGFIKNPYPWTATKPVIAYTTATEGESNIITDCEYILDGDSLHLYPEDLRDGHNIILRALDVSPGMYLEVTVHDPDSDKLFVFDRIIVGNHGIVVVSLNYEEQRDVPLAVTAITFLGILVCLGVGWHILRKA